MKYEDAIKRDSNEAHSIILEQIRPNSKILEFGPAGGRMTQILKKELNSCVFIVEYEEAAFEKVMKYADEGICSDIEKLEWKHIWKDYKFDFIIFADVLEHLKQPMKILEETYDLLSEDGSVLISIPNIAHNDILIKLYENHFDYTDIGILDNTHLHFWAEENLDEFEKDTGYQICDIKYKTVPTWTTEQFRNTDKIYFQALQELLSTRKNGEVYQFILNLKKKSYVAEKGILKHVQAEVGGHLFGRLYYDRGNGFSQEDSKTVVANINRNNRYSVEIEEKLDDNISRLRYDMLEGQSCVIYNLRISLNNEDDIEIESKYLENSDKVIFLDSDDPQLVFGNVGGKTVSINLEFSISKNDICDFYKKRYEDLMYTLNSVWEEKTIVIEETSQNRIEK